MIDEDIKKLDAIAKKMESGELNLEESLDSFKDGIELVKKCQKQIESAELKVKEILDADGDIEEGDLQ